MTVLNNTQVNSLITCIERLEYLSKELCMLENTLFETNNKQMRTQDQFTLSLQITALNTSIDYLKVCHKHHKTEDTT